MSVKCDKCGKQTAEENAVLLDIVLSARTFSRGEKTAPYQHHTITICPSCRSEITEQANSLIDIITAGIQERTLTFKFKLPKVGESVFEVIDAKYPIIESIITKNENGRYEAKAKNIPEAGTISFTPYEIGRTVFLSHREAVSYKKELGKDL